MRPLLAPNDFVNKGLNPRTRHRLALPSCGALRDPLFHGPRMPIDLATVASRAGIAAAILGFALLVVSVNL